MQLKFKSTYFLQNTGSDKKKILRDIKTYSSLKYLSVCEIWYPHCGVCADKSAVFFGDVATCRLVEMLEEHDSSYLNI